MKLHSYFFKAALLMCGLALICGCMQESKSIQDLRNGFESPPNSARPGVYWYFMDGNMSREAITKDLESMKTAGIGHLIFLEVNVGVPRGKVDFLSDEWKSLFKHAVEEAERLGITITLGVGPGWTGSGGPWVLPEESMLHMVSSTIEVSGPRTSPVTLALPEPKPPYFGTWGFTPKMMEEWKTFYKDVAVLAFPSNKGERITDTDEKALYYRAPYSSVKGVKQFLPTLDFYPTLAEDMAVGKTDIIDLTDKMRPDGTLDWEVPKGNWTIMRFVARNNGAVTRPAPLPGVGMESDKFDTTALNAHLNQFTGVLFDYIGKRNNSLEGGLKMLHMDSWEMGAQNWTPAFRKEFTKRRGYDPLPYYPVYAGVIVDSREISERFLWDLRMTSQELILENHAGHIRKYAHQRGYGLSIEPYDMNPSADLELGAVADVPMCEYWSVGYGYNTAFSAIEGSSLAHLKGQTVVPAESFTAANDGWRQHPASMKDQSDWALASGINRLVFHTFQHQSLPDNLRPGMTMGPYGVHWDRNQTWWYMADAYHRYITRCQFMLQQGRTVADILYLSPEGAPHVFRAPDSALDFKIFDSIKDINGAIFSLPDKRGYNFDAAPPSFIYLASVRDNKIVFPGGASYHMLVLPVFETMTPGLLRKVMELVNAGALVVGNPPVKSPSLSGYPACDEELAELVTQLWGGNVLPDKMEQRSVGKGRVIWGRAIASNVDRLYPAYGLTSEILQADGVPDDFKTSLGGDIRYTHRTSEQYDLYFVANRTDHRLSAECLFRLTDRQPELWSAITGKMVALPEYTVKGKQTAIKLEFEPTESYFIVFPKSQALKPSSNKNFHQDTHLLTLDKAWTVSFDPKWGGPESITFDSLTDWSKHTLQGIKYYSGTAFYRQKFTLSAVRGKTLFLDLGRVKNMAKVTLNGKELGVLWTTPWRIEISDVAKEGENELTVEVVNLWPNRLIGDEQLPDDYGIKDGVWPQWLLNGEPQPGKRYTFTTHKHYNKDSKLLESGLLGPVTIVEQKQ